MIPTSRHFLLSLSLYFIASLLPHSTSAQVATGTPPLGIELKIQAKDILAIRME